MDITDNDFYRTKWLHECAILRNAGIEDVELLRQKVGNFMYFSFPDRQKCRDILDEAIEAKNLFVWHQFFLAIARGRRT
jgi:hypothetical protein